MESLPSPSSQQAPLPLQDLVQADADSWPRKYRWYMSEKLDVRGFAHKLYHDPPEEQRFFELLIRAEESIMKETGSSCHCQRCIVFGNGLSNVLQALAGWDRGFNYPPFEEPRTNLVTKLALRLSNIIGENVRDDPYLNGPRHIKMSAEVIFYWLVLEIVRIYADCNPIRMIRILETNADATNSVYNLLFRAVKLVTEEALPRDCQTRCLSRPQCTCFAIRLRTNLLAHLPNPFLPHSEVVPESFVGADRPRHLDYTEIATMLDSTEPIPIDDTDSKYVCARFGCGATQWTEAATEKESVDPKDFRLKTIKLNLDPREFGRAVARRDWDEGTMAKAEPLRRCATCEKAFYCSKRHAREAWKVHRFVCDLEVTDSEGETDSESFDDVSGLWSSRSDDDTL